VNRLNESVVNDNKGNLISFFTEKFGPLFLPSHNLDHHLRVWIYAAGIVTRLRERGFQFSNDFLSGLQIACLTHDIGLAIEKGEGHGKASRLIASEYPLLNSLPAAVMEEVLFSVENHDRKDYIRVSPPESMLTILSVADDLDAFGFIGIYRYIEISLERGIAHASISDSVTANLAARYIHLVKVYGFLPDFISAHTTRYEIARDFFNPEGPFSASAKIKTITIIEEELLKKHKDITAIAAEYKSATDSDIAHFFRSLYKELMMAEYV
jgi:HD superfamily phosphodiesterase